MDFQENLKVAATLPIKSKNHWYLDTLNQFTNFLALNELGHVQQETRESGVTIHFQGVDVPVGPFNSRSDIWAVHAANGDVYAAILVLETGNIYGFCNDYNFAAMRPDDLLHIDAVDTLQKALCNITTYIANAQGKVKPPEAKLVDPEMTAAEQAKAVKD